MYGIQKEKKMTFFFACWACVLSINVCPTRILRHLEHPCFLLPKYKELNASGGKFKGKIFIE